MTGVVIRVPEAHTRLELIIGNCYAVSPERVVNRFKAIRSLVLKGKPRFADFSLLPPDWGAQFNPWVTVLKDAYRGLEKLCLKRMCVMNSDLLVVANSFVGFKEIVIVCCDGFGTCGLAVLACKCRQLRVLELIEDEVRDDEEDWISYFPEGGTCLESLIFDCVECPINFDALEKLVASSPALKKLRVNRHVTLGQLHRLMISAPQLTELGTGSYSPSGNPAPADQELDRVSSAFAACRSLVCLSGFRELAPDFLPAVYPVCANITSLNFSYANINANQFEPVIRHCHKLQILWVLDSIRDEGLQAVAATCADLRELRVFPIDALEVNDGPVSDVGLHAIAEGCKKLQSILYFCQQMTNAAVISMSINCPDLVVFRLCIIGRYRPDHSTGEPMDEGFGAIVKNCKKLTRLAVSGLLTDKAFSYIGQYGKLVRTLSVAFAGDSDMGLTYVLEGCDKLEKLEIRDSPFGDSALRSGMHHYHNMRFLWMSTCRATRQGCREIARHIPGVIVEVFSWNQLVEEGEKSDFVDTLYLYRSLEGPRADAPRFVKIL
ncbi:Transport inhibitor response 1-like protein [Heracleum sosnowskyi]|uniref:Transport inhibitor response 1-like protein n=1 Tax=Heracleum sosnowskyi TaxID=360622 RepID=A0AAD8J1P5_9APIA|nr:Transport inhibitor response 1-like protein [Heracleum sosnowskyi]